MSMSKRSKAILALTVATALAVAAVSADAQKQERAIDLPYIDVGSHDSSYEDFSSPPIWTNTKDNNQHDNEYCGPGPGRSISRCSGLGRGGHTFPGDISGAPSAGPGDWDRHRGRRRRQLVRRRQLNKREIDMPDSELHLEDVRLSKRGMVSWPNSDLHLEDVHVDFEKRQEEPYYDPTQDPEPDVFENDVKIYKRVDGDVDAAVAVEAGAQAEASAAVKVKRSVVIYDDDKPHLLEDAGSFDTLMADPAESNLKKRQETFYDPEKDEEPDVFENDVRIYKRDVEDDEDEDLVFDLPTEDDNEVDEENDEEYYALEVQGIDEEEDEDEERRLDDEAGVQDWIEEMKMDELFELEGHPDGLHLDDEENQDGLTPSEEEIFAARFEQA
ncbi:hypothetical protein BGZ73_002971 [Actinomortierella ambigua]|nr:hypothetical protein BGZ73_002971 [Actinomortierella ambigua]